MSIEQWSEAAQSRARQYWTPQRVEQLTGGKDLTIRPDTDARLLRGLGLLHRDGSMPADRRRKYFQLNHMIRLLRPPLQELMSEGAPVHIVDAGCGRSYLTLALAWSFQHFYDHEARVLGIDRNIELVNECRRRAELCGLSERVRYAATDLSDADVEREWEQKFDSPSDISAVISLHACDTATDYAIALGVDLGAPMIAVAPCCQAELARAWAQLAKDDVQGPFRAVWNSPHLRREHAASVTDALRALLLRAAGYETRVVQFVASQHTPKNTLIRAVRRCDADANARVEYDALKDSTGGAPIILESLLDTLRV